MSGTYEDIVDGHARRSPLPPLRSRATSGGAKANGDDAMSERYDLVVIGGGSGGVRAARIATQFGVKVALVEEARLGGTCVNVGCVPKKIFTYAASYGAALKDARGYGWSVGESSFEWSELIAATHAEVARLNGIYAGILERANVETIQGRAVLQDRNTVAVQVDGETVRTLETEKILIATGGRPVRPPIDGKELAWISDTIFELESLPESLAVIGGGYIATELGGALSALGVDVTLIHRGEHLLSGFDKEVSAHLTETIDEHSSMKLILNTNVRALEKDPKGGVIVHLDGDHEPVRAEAALAATGRAPNSAGIGLEEAGVKLNSWGAVCVDEDHRTNVPNIFAVGDVTDRLALTPVALGEGMAFAKAQFGPDESTRQIPYSIVPTAVFSKPEVGTCGLTEEQAIDKGHPVTIFTSRFRPMKNILAGRSDKMFMKLIVDSESDLVLGVHIVGEGAGEMLQGFGVAMTCGATKAELDATIGIHPTAAEELVTMRTPTR